MKFCFRLKLERVVRKRRREHPSVTYGRPLKIVYRSANFVKDYPHVTQNILFYHSACHARIPRSQILSNIESKWLPVCHFGFYIRKIFHALSLFNTSTLYTIKALAIMQGLSELLSKIKTKWLTIGLLEFYISQNSPVLSVCNTGHLLYITALVIIQDFRDIEKKKLKRPPVCYCGFCFCEFVMGYPCVRPYILLYIHGPAILYCL